MAYATFNDVLTRYKPLGSMIGTHSMEVTTADVSSIFIYGAEGVVNGYLASRYVVPIPMPEPLITRIAADLATFDMMAEKLPAVPDFMIERYNRSIGLLEMLRDGKMSLTQSATLITSGDQEAWSSTGSYHPIFSTVLDIENQAPDADQIIDDKATRGIDVCSY